MIISIQPICRKDKIRQDETVLVYLRVTHNRARRYISTGIYIQATDWDFENLCIIGEKPENEEVRLKIESIKYKYIKRLKQLEVLDKEITLDALLDEKKVKTTSYTVKECLEQTIERLETLGKYNSASKHKTALSLFLQFKPSATRLEEIDFQLLEEFELFLIRRGNQSNSIATKFSLLKAAYNKAAGEGKFTSKTNPFTKFKVGKLWTTTQKRAIAREDIALIENYSPQCTNTEYILLARDIFLFSYYTAGINFTDIAPLRYSDIVDDRFYYSRRKTQKLFSFQLVPNTNILANGGPITPMDGGGQINSGRQMEEVIASVNPSVGSIKSRG